VSADVNVKANVAAFVSGAIFAVGLAISGMVLPEKVIGFLDVSGAWDPSLAFVMIGAIGVHATLRVFIARRGRPLFDDRFHLPTRTRVDGRLVLGAATFGVGWGLSGYCPGPALLSLASGAIAPVIFVAAMALGMVVISKVATVD
jgi:uncharacterized membrane protein YedE/YeeE